METLIVTFAIAWTAIVGYSAFLTVQARKLSKRLAELRRPGTDKLGDRALVRSAA
jgi:CcmD family protein